METRETAYCQRCGRDDLLPSALCTVTEDLGPDHDPEFARYEGLCRYGSPLAGRETLSATGCCGHNHS